MSDPSPHDRPNYKPGGVTGKGFRPGQSGNPGGRPKGSGVTGSLRRLLLELHNGTPIEELVAQRWLKDALSGKPAALAMLLDRTEGRPTEKHEVSVAARPWREALESMTDGDKIEMAVEAGCLDLLSPRLRELAAAGGLIPALPAAGPKASERRD